VYRAGDFVWFTWLRGWPDAEYGFVFSPEEAEKWEARHRAAREVAKMIGRSRASNDRVSVRYGATEWVGRGPSGQSSNRVVTNSGHASASLAEEVPHQIALPEQPQPVR
jgi:hypothetical protein